jgi:hypothetical protein
MEWMNECNALSDLRFEMVMQTLSQGTFVDYPVEELRIRYIPVFKSYIVTPVDVITFTASSPKSHFA